MASEFPPSPIPDEPYPLLAGVNMPQIQPTLGQFEAHRLLDGTPKGENHGLDLLACRAGGDVGHFIAAFPLVLYPPEAYSQVQKTHRD